MVSLWWVLVAVLIGTVVGYAWGADANTPTFRPLEPGEKVLVPMDDGDAIAIDEGITWTFGYPREQSRLKALRKRYLDARFNATVEITE